MREPQDGKKTRNKGNVSRSLQLDIQKVPGEIEMLANNDISGLRISFYLNECLEIMFHKGGRGDM